MLSGVGPKAHLQELGIPLKKDLPVGLYLKDHQFIFMPSRTNVTLGLTTNDILSPVNELLYNTFGIGPFGSTGLDGSAFVQIDKSKRGRTYPDIQLLMIQYLFTSNALNLKEDYAGTLLDKDPGQPGMTIAVCLTRPRSTGNIRLRSTDPFDPPVVNSGYFTNKEDMKTMIGGLRNWEKLVETQAMRSIGVDINQLRGPTCAEHEFRSDAFWECFIRHVLASGYHHTSSCRMGPDGDPLAVVDPELRIYGIKNLRVADASVFHDITAGNTNAPTIMISEKAADMIRGIDSVDKLRKNLPV